MKIQNDNIRDDNVRAFVILLTKTFFIYSDSHFYDVVNSCFPFVQNFDVYAVFCVIDVDHNEILVNDIYEDVNNDGEKEEI